MRRSIPPRPSGNDREATFMQWVWDSLREMFINDTDDIKASRDSRGVYLRSTVHGGGGAQPTPAKEYRIKSVSDDYITCRSWDGSTDGGMDVIIAKDHKLKCSLATATIFGVIHTYTYAPGPDSNNKLRTNTWPTGNEQELVTPPWNVNDIVYAIPAETSLVGPDSKKIKLITAGPCRQWAKIPPSP